jgi:hypothetical protein
MRALFEFDARGAHLLGNERVCYICNRSSEVVRDIDHMRIVKMDKESFVKAAAYSADYDAMALNHRTCEVQQQMAIYH